MVNFGNISPIDNCNMAQNVIFAKVKVLVKQHGTIRFLGLKKHIDLDTKIIILLKCFSAKVMAKGVFLQNGGQYNIFM